MNQQPKEWVRTSFPLRKDQAETLYHLSYKRRESQASILRAALDYYFDTLKARGDESASQN